MLLPGDTIIWPGDILFYTPDSVPSRLVAWVTRSPVSHVEIAVQFRKGSKERQSIGAHWNGVKVRPCARPAYIGRLYGAGFGRAFLWAFRQQERKYDLLSLLAALFKALHIPITMSLRDAYTCSEFAARFLEFVDDARLQQRLAEFDDLENVSPGDLLLMFQKLESDATIMEALKREGQFNG